MFSILIWNFIMASQAEILKEKTMRSYYRGVVSEKLFYGKHSMLYALTVRSTL